MAKIIIVLVAAMTLVVQSWAQTCSTNEEPSYCVTSCEDYCNRGDDPIACTLECKFGCKCAAGFIREAIDSTKCISNEDCKKIKKCGNNKVFKICGSQCPEYCGKPEGPCTKDCVADCQCKDGYVLKSNNSSECILGSECPNQ